MFILNMKLKQRITIGFGALCVCGVLFIVPALLDSPKEFQEQINEVFLPEHRPEDVAVAHNDIQANLAPGNQGHLNVFRKDLDVSNYSSNHNRQSPEIDNDNINNLNLKLPLNLPHTELVQYVLNNKQILDNSETLIEVAKLLQKSKRRDGILRQNLTKEFEPDKGDVVLPGGFYKDLDIKHEWERRKMPVEVELTKEIDEFLEEIVRKMSGAHLHKVGRRKGSEMKIYDTHKNLTAWQRWHNTITQFNMYKSNDRVIDEVLHDLRTLDLTEMYQHEGGTQLKIVYYLSNDGRAMFKPMRYPRDVETLPDHFYFSDYERHTAEIAAFNLDRVPQEQDTLPDHSNFVDFERHHAEIGTFHLDRVLGFHRVPPTTGRWFNVTQDVKRMADTKLLKTFFVSPAGNICFHGACDYYCDTGHAVCGHPDMLQGSMMAYLPSSNVADRKSWRHPWRRSYSKHKKADWETNNNYCYEVRHKPPYNTGRRLLDLMDMSVFDFLQGNLDRHHYETFEDFGNFTFTLHLDNGRGFGKSFEDDLSIIAPICQCCLFRYSTLEKLFKFYKGPQHLSDAMHESLASDPVTPVLLERHLHALDRRVKILLKTVYKCIDKNGLNRVVIDDGF